MSTSFFTSGCCELANVTLASFRLATALFTSSRVAFSFSRTFLADSNALLYASLASIVAFLYSLVPSNALSASIAFWSSALFTSAFFSTGASFGVNATKLLKLSVVNVSLPSA